jgi:hypothetical protein
MNQINLDHFKKMIHDKVQERAGKFIEELEAHIDENLRIVVRQTLGFEKDFGSRTWRMDHFNKEASVMKYVSEEASKKAKEIIHKIITPEVVEEILMEQHKEIIRNFKQTFRDHLRENIYTRAKTLAEKVALEAIKELEVTVSTDIDINDPNSSNNKLGEEILKKIAKDTVIAAEKESKKGE